MLELKVKDVRILEDMIYVFNTNGYKVTAYVWWTDKVGGEISHYTIEVFGIAPDVQSMPRVYKSSRQAMGSLWRNIND